MNAEAKKVLEFWFGSVKDNLTVPEKSSLWYAKDSKFDSEIKMKFGDLVKKASTTKLDHWLDSPKGSLAFIILLDQFSRNLNRGSAKAFESDEIALHATQNALSRDYHQELFLIERQFLYMPLMHSEELSDQKKCVELMKELENSAEGKLKDFFQNASKYAERHYEIIKRFGRFPHRNDVLGRKSTKEEIEFLKEPMSSF